jgi:hypothetical protein
MALLGASTASVAPAGAAAAASVTVTSSVPAPVTGQRVTLRITVTDPSNEPAMTSGTATVLDGPDQLGTATVTRGRGTFSTRALGAGAHLISASFVPLAGGPPIVSGVLPQTVLPAATAVGLRTSRPVAAYGDGGAITASVTAVAPGSGVPTGSVDFAVDGDWFQSVPLGATGKAVLPLSELYPSLLPGSYAVSATFTGDANYGPSTAPGPATQTITGPSEAPVTTLSPNAAGLPVFSPRSFTLSSMSPFGCSVTITNQTPTAQALVYGTPGSWKRLPGGTIAAGASKGVGVSLSGYTAYFSTMANTRSYVAIHCR